MDNKLYVYYIGTIDILIQVNKFIRILDKIYGYFIIKYFKIIN